MYEKAEKNVKKTAQQIVDNLNDIAKPKASKGKDYLKDGKSVVNVKMPLVDSEVGMKLGKYMEKQVKETKNSSKKVKADIESE